MIRETFSAMGTEVIVIGETTHGIEATRQLFAAVERRCSRFQGASELSILNAQPGGSVAVSPTLAAVFATALELRDLTQGLVDPAIGGQVIEWGYDRTFSEVIDLPDQPATTSPLHWSLGEGYITRPEGVRFDLGGIAKGWTCDRAVESEMALIVSAGGDMRSSIPEAVAQIMDPWDTAAASVAVGVGALATSSVTRRSWQVAGRGAHHIIDPRTGQPAASPILSASVAAARAAEAEAGAKAVLLLGESGLEWADRRPWLHGAVVTWDTGAVYATGSLELAA